MEVGKDDGRSRKVGVRDSFSQRCETDRVRGRVAAVEDAKEGVFLEVLVSCHCHAHAATREFART